MAIKPKKEVTPADDQMDVEDMIPPNEDGEFDGQGHNGGPPLEDPPPTDKAVRKKLTDFVAELDRIDEERKTLAERTKEVKAQAKAFGFDVKALNMAMAARKADAKDAEARKTLEDTRDFYLEILTEQI